MTGTQDELWEWGKVVVIFFQSLIEKIGGYLPQVIGAIVILAVGWLGAKFLKGLTVKILQVCGIEEFSKKIKLHSILTKIGMTGRLDQMIGCFVYYIILLIFVISASEVLGFKLVLDTLNKFIAYLPHVFGAFLILIIALYLAKITKDAIASASINFNIAYAGAMSAVLEIVIVGFGIILALTELGLDMSIFTANVTIIITGIVLAMAVSIGLGSRTIMSNVLARYYTAQLFHVGDTVCLAGHKGTIVKVTPISVLIQTDRDEQLYIPNERIIEEGSTTRKITNS